jgi:hypothetical protein
MFKTTVCTIQYPKINCIYHLLHLNSKTITELPNQLNKNIHRLVEQEFLLRKTIPKQGVNQLLLNYIPKYNLITKNNTTVIQSLID